MPTRDEGQYPVQPAAPPAPVHLTDEQFTGLLLGAIPPAAIGHLESCRQCAEEAQRVSGAIGSFAQQSRLWAEGRVAAGPAQKQGRPASLAWLRTPIPPVAWVAAIFLLGAGLGLAHRARHRASSPQIVAVVQPALAGPAAPAAVAPATLKADNELLSAIDGELSDTDISGTQTYGLATSRHPARAHSSKGVSD
jgi:hypothetical protein